MTGPELLAWHNGFMIGLTDDANPHAVIELLNYRIGQIDEVPTPYPIFIEQYWPFPQTEDLPWWKRWLLLWGPSWAVAYDVAAADAHRFRDATEAFYALGQYDARRMRPA